jgi:transcription-repair coupling factor (superfamily II helicase)
LRASSSRPRPSARSAPARWPSPTPAIAAFVDRFPYEETDDQDRAIGDVIDDLGAGKPMDRLVCGDVGFGKTEVALRAAFVAAMAGMQVAVVARPPCSPASITTIRRALPGLPDRDRPPLPPGHAPEAKETKRGVADGKIDIVIGTHAILAKGVEFKNLGLVIVDEEQRFGVTHKERLKALRADVHVLTLTATPIPRTLQMAMSGLRELSVIQTPPVDRLAVRTYVMPWDPVVIREALLREHYRGGQSFFVAPRIADLPDIEEFLRDEVPEVRYVVAHGQMAPTEVEERMSAFYDRKYDVLLSTTIVESGLDIPSANTLIIHRADRFGLAQLYQLRGRVGGPRPAPMPISPRRDRHRHRNGGQAAAGARQPRQPRRRLPARQPRSRHPRRRQSARRRAVGPHQGSRLRTLPVDAGGGDPGGQGGGASRARRGLLAADHVDAPIMIPTNMCPTSTCAWASTGA